MRLLVAVLLVLSQPLQAQEARVRVQADTSVIRVGDRITFTVAVEHAADERVVWPDSLDLGSFEVLAAEALPPQQVEGRSVTAARFALTAFELGELKIPSFDLTVEGTDGSVTNLSTDAWGVDVVSVGLDEEEELRGIKGPMMIALTFVSLLPWLVAIAVLIAVGVWFWRRRRPHDSSPLGPVKMARPPHEIAYEALDQLDRSGLLQRDEVKEYHVRVSEIIRSYVEGRYEIYALEMTTVELVDRLWRVGIEGDLLDRFRRFLERADLVKFAKAHPTSDRSRKMLAIARALVDDTRPHLVVRDADAELLGSEEE
jgi:hypothetical protein